MNSVGAGPAAPGGGGGDGSDDGYEDDGTPTHFLFEMTSRNECTEFGRWNITLEDLRVEIHLLEGSTRTSRMEVKGRGRGFSVILNEYDCFKRCP